MKMLLSIIAAIFLLAPFSAKADTNTLEQQLRDHTFAYIDAKTGLEHTIYIGRFGNNYDEYYPCEFVDGTWRITNEGRLCLEDSVNKSRRNGENCLKPQIKGDQVSFFDTAGNLAYQTKLTKGNGMPLG